MPVKYWEIIADNLSNAGWSLAWESCKAKSHVKIRRRLTRHIGTAFCRKRIRIKRIWIRRRTLPRQVLRLLPDPQVAELSYRGNRMEEP